MNEDYVSFEVAKMLKEKGFRWGCQAFYNADGMLTASPVHTINDELEDSDIAAPTLYMAQKWMRTKGYHVDILYMYDYSWAFEIYSIYGNDLITHSYRDGTSCRSYEEALEAGIIEALKLI